MSVVLLTFLSREDLRQLSRGGGVKGRDALPTQIARFLTKADFNCDERFFSALATEADASGCLLNIQPPTNHKVALLDPEAILPDLALICDGAVQRVAVKALKSIEDPVAWQMAIGCLHRPWPHGQRMEQIVHLLGRARVLELRVKRPLVQSDVRSILDGVIVS